MSAIPPNWLGSIIQSTGAQQRATASRAAEGAAPGDKGGFADRLQDVIDSNDRDSQVYSDAEGAGSQGRPSDGSPDKSEDENAPPAESSGAGLDVEA